MILVTVGMQLGFDRLIVAMDGLAPDLGEPVIAQTGTGAFTPKKMDARSFIAPDEFEALARQARLIISHAGIGTVLTAARHSKPIVLMPRRASLGEHRNDHQLATVANLKGRAGILIAETEADLADTIAQGFLLGEVSHRSSIQATELKRAIGQFIETGTL